jgi:D-alanyl-lipoteichoic acid acyltransferase DltB (MBOAT superfamily)
MSYVFDVYYKRAAVQKSFRNVALYISMFPQLIAGPIVRYETVAGEIVNRKENAGDFFNGMTRFILGLGKKVLIANYIGFITDSIFKLSGNLSVATAWLGDIAYMLQVYFDFSAYSDMAIGLGMIFGFHFHENFNYPFISKSITEFWKRWHISLGTWFRDYIYIPMGGSHVPKGRNVFNMFMVWFLTGLWHGANWTFILWGIFYFLLLLFEKKTNAVKRLGPFARLYALFFILIGGVIIRSESLGMMARFFGAMFGICATGLTDEYFFSFLSGSKWVFLTGIILSAPVFPYFRDRLFRLSKPLYSAVSFAGLLLIFVTSLLVCVKSTYNPFIYFNF